MMIPALLSPLKRAPKADFDGRAYDDSIMMDFTDSTQEEVDEYYGDIGSLYGEGLKLYLYDVISENNYFLQYGSGSSGVGKYYQITDRNWELSEPIEPSTFKFSAEGDEDFYLRLLYSTGNDSKKTAYNNRVNGYKIDSSLDYIDYENGLKNNSNIQVDKEHVWVKSHGFGGDPIPGAGTDIHHLIAADHVTNHRHSDYYYGEVANINASSTDEVYCYLADGTSELSGYLGLDADGEKVFEPNDEYKGDVARAIFYMATRYGKDTGNNTKEEPYLVVTDDDSLQDDNDIYHGVHHNLSALLEWNEIDPVDEYEIHRNNLIYKNVQRNRNPYVDHPEWVRRVFDEDYYSNLEIDWDSDYYLHVGDEFSLKVPDISFETIDLEYDPTIISIDETDYSVTPLKSGETDVVLKYEIEDGIEKEVSTQIHVNDAVTVSGLTDSEVELIPNQTYQIPELTYQNLFSNEIINFTSSNNGVASVTSDGLITAISAGTCDINIRVNGPDVYKTVATIKVTVPSPAPNIDIVLDSDYYLHVGDKYSLDIDCDSSSIIRTTYDENIITFNKEDFSISATGIGDTELTIKYKTGYEEKEVTCQIHVKDKIEITGLNFNIVSLFASETYQLPTFEYKNLFDNEKVTYKSTDERVATVDSSGLISGKIPGECYIEIQVESPTQTKTLNQISVKVELNERQKFIIIIIVAAVLLVVVFILIFAIVHHVNKKGSKNPKDKKYNKRR